MSVEELPEIHVGVIGGSGLYNLGNLTFVKEVNVQTPWGSPSSPITISKLPTGEHLAFLARHGHHHDISPSDVPFAANIAALKHIGVKAILAFSAVGSLREEIRPGDFIIPDQIIDRTKGTRVSTFFQGTRIVAHATFGDPFSKKFSEFIAPLVKRVLDDAGHGSQLHTKKTVVCMEGPLFSTRAESHMYRAWGGDIINMSVIPEAKLAREAELSYALIATATDYDAWRENEESVTVAEVIKTLHTNAATSQLVASSILAELHEAVVNKVVTSDVEGGMQYSIITAQSHHRQEDKEKLGFILPYFKD